MNATERATGFQHEALLYHDGVDGFVRAIAPMVADTLSRGGSAAVAAPPDRIARLQAVFGDHRRLDLLDMTTFGINPGRIIPVWRDLADDALAAGGPFLGVGEPAWVGRTADELDECHCHEALINVAFGDDPAWRLVCPYDVDGLTDAVIESAHATHPTLLHRGHEAPTGADGSAVRGTLEHPLSPVPEDAVTFAFDHHDLGVVRDLAAEHGRAAGLDRERLADLVLAVAELATNSIRHGGGGGTLSIWHRGAGVLCQTRDRGRISDPLVGRRRPSVEGPGGRGMWIVQQLCDLVQVRSSSRGTVVRVTLG